MFLDTYFAVKKIGPSLRSYTYTQLFVTDFGYVGITYMKLRSQLPLALKLLFKSVGVPNKILCDGPPERIKGDYIRLCKKSDTQIIQQERGTPWDNRAEGHVGIIKSLVKTDLKEFNYPMVHLSNDPLIIWFYAAERRANIISSFSRNIYELRGQVPYTKATGYETDISALAELKYYFPIFIRETSSMLRSI